MSSSSSSPAAATRLQIRPVRLSDLDALQLLHERLSATEHNPFTALIANRALVALELKRLRQTLLATERYVCFVATTEDETLVGYCAGVIEQAPTLFTLQYYGTVSEVFVDEAFRRHGVGRQLVRAVVETFVSRGVERIDATVTHAQPAGRALLASLGFASNTEQLVLDTTREASNAESGGDREGADEEPA